VIKFELLSNHLCFMVGSRSRKAVSRQFTGSASLLTVQQLHPPQQLQKLSKWCWFAATDSFMKLNLILNTLSLVCEKRTSDSPGWCHKCICVQKISG